MWEGGIRVPFIIAGPDIQPNSWSHVPIVGYDLFPTFCSWAKIPQNQLPRNIEGGSFAHILPKDGQGEINRSRSGLFFHFPHYQSEDGPQSSVRDGNWKLIYFYEDQHAELFNLENDISERTNLAAKDPARTMAMQTQLESYLREINAQFPTPNPEFDPSSPSPARKGKGRNEKPNNRPTRTK